MGTGAIEGPTSYCEGERVPWRHWPLGERSWSPASGLWGQAKPWEGLRPLASHTAAAPLPPTRQPPEKQQQLFQSSPPFLETGVG